MHEMRFLINNKFDPISTKEETVQFKPKRYTLIVCFIILLVIIILNVNIDVIIKNVRLVYYIYINV